MLYNTRMKRAKKVSDCFTCPKWDNKTKSCNGLNSVCFEYDEKTKTAFDGKSKLPIKV